MPHYADGTEAKKGDHVMVPCIVTDVFEGELYCTVNLATELTMPPYNNATPLTLNAQQCRKVPES